MNGLTLGRINVLRGLSSVGARRTKHVRRFRQALDRTSFRRYVERDSDVVSDELASPVRRDLGSLWQWLPPDALCPSQGDFEPG